MLKHVLVATLFISAMAARAEVIVYQAKTSTKRTGEGYEDKTSFQEYLVWNLDDNHVSQIIFAKFGLERFYYTDGWTPYVVQYDGLRGRRYTTFSGAGSTATRDLMEFNRGQNANLRTSLANIWSFPRTFKGSGQIINTVADPVLTEYTRTAVFSEKRTKAANDSSLTEPDVFVGLVIELQLKGYVSLDDSLAAASASTNKTATNATRRLSGYERMLRAAGQTAR